VEAVLVEVGGGSVLWGLLWFVFGGALGLGMRRFEGQLTIERNRSGVNIGRLSRKRILSHVAVR